MRREFDDLLFSVLTDKNDKEAHERAEAAKTLSEMTSEELWRLFPIFLVPRKSLCEL